jgi:hypothetical protein
MILTTHAVVGAALASFVPSHPVAAFVLGFGSHFILDAIPHVDYPIRSRSVNPRIGAPMSFDRALFQDVVTIGADGLFGLAAAVVLFSSATNFWAILMGAVGAILPDLFSLAPRAASDASAFPFVGPLKEANWQRSIWGEHAGSICRLDCRINVCHS